MFVFGEEDFEPLPPIEYSALKSVVVRHFDKSITEFTTNEIKENIEQTNEWATVEQVVMHFSAAAKHRITSLVAF